MNIFDPRDCKTYTIKSPRIVWQTKKNKHGEEESVKCVEYTIEGNNHDWDFWMTHKEFIEANPEINI